MADLVSGHPAREATRPCSANYRASETEIGDGSKHSRDRRRIASEQGPPEALAAVMAREPDLTIEGWRLSFRAWLRWRGKFDRNLARMPPAEQRAAYEADHARARAALATDVAEFATACRYLGGLAPTKAVGPRAPGSYGLKHWAESWGRDNGLAGYVANGTLIAAALALEFPIQRDAWGRSPNCHIGVSRRSLRAVRVCARPTSSDTM